MKTKSLLVLLMSVWSLIGVAQVYTTGFGKLYQFPFDYDYSYDIYFAHIPYMDNGQKYADMITFVNGKYSELSYNSSYGLYYAFQYNCGDIVSGRGLKKFVSSEQFIFYVEGVEGNGYSCFSIVKDENNRLCVVNVQTDEIVHVLIDNVPQVADLDILIQQKFFDRGFKPDIYISNRGNLYHFSDDISYSNTNSIKSRPADESTSNKAYNMSGMEVDPSNERVFIQDGKVKMNTK